jgi:hypothetical protein
MCQNCNCDFFDRCSIVGYMPIGFCCENCYLYDKNRTCLHSKSKTKEEEKPGTKVIEKIILHSATVEGELLKISISQKDVEEKTIYIDLKKYLKS